MERKVGLRDAMGPALLVGLAALFVLGPVGWPCPMATMLGVPCPTCGMTRATRLALHGRLGEATHMHPLWFVVVPALAWWFVVEARGFVRTGKWGTPASPRAKRIAQAIVALVICVWIARFFGAFGGPVPVHAIWK